MSYKQPTEVIVPAVGWEWRVSIWEDSAIIWRPDGVWSHGGNYCWSIHDYGGVMTVYKVRKFIRKYLSSVTPPKVKKSPIIWKSRHRL